MSASTTCYSIKNSWQIISRMYNSYAEPKGLTISTAYVLMNLNKDTGIPSTQLASQLGMELTSLSRILKSLEEKNLLIKTPDDTDRRQVYLTLTSEGEEKKQQAKKIIKQFNKRLSDEISSDKMRVFLDVLNQINTIAESEHFTQ